MNRVLVSSGTTANGRICMELESLNEVKGAKIFEEMAKIFPSLMKVIDARPKEIKYKKHEKKKRTINYTINMHKTRFCLKPYFPERKS